MPRALRRCCPKDHPSGPWYVVAPPHTHTQRSPTWSSACSSFSLRRCDSAVRRAAVASTPSSAARRLDDSSTSTEHPKIQQRRRRVGLAVQPHAVLYCQGSATISSQAIKSVTANPPQAQIPTPVNLTLESCILCRHGRMVARDAPQLLKLSQQLGCFSLQNSIQTAGLRSTRHALPTRHTILLWLATANSAQCIHTADA